MELPDKKLIAPGPENSVDPGVILFLSCVCVCFCGCGCGCGCVGGWVWMCVGVGGWVGVSWCGCGRVCWVRAYVRACERKP